MGLSLIALFLFVTYLKIQLVHNQYWNGYGSCDAYTDYGQPCYTQTHCPCSQLCCDNYQSYNPYRSEQPVVIVIEKRDEDDGWMDVINLISSLQNQLNVPVYISHPILLSNCDNDSDNGCLDCVCKNKASGCSTKCENYNSCDNGCNCSCGCRNKKKSKSNCNSGERSDSNCNCKNSVILHKSECCCRS